MSDGIGRWFLCLIASLLFIMLGADWMVPSISLRTYRNEYQEIVVACETARRTQREASTRSFENQGQKDLFLKSVETELLVCLEKDLLRNELLASGVSQPDLRLIELGAIRQNRDLPFAALDSSGNGDVGKLGTSTALASLRPI